MLGARGEVSTTRMKEALTQHFSEARHHETSSTYKTAAMQFLDEKFKSMGLEVKYHNFDMANGSVSTCMSVGGMGRGQIVAKTLESRSRGYGFNTRVRQ